MVEKKVASMVEMMVALMVEMTVVEMVAWKADHLVLLAYLLVDKMVA
jgi:hypothetical protein